eukprot:4275184-Prymnesium_polylepis.1
MGAPPSMQRSFFTISEAYHFVLKQRQPPPARSPHSVGTATARTSTRRSCQRGSTIVDVVPDRTWYVDRGTSIEERRASRVQEIEEPDTHTRRTPAPAPITVSARACRAAEPEAQWPVRVVSSSAPIYSPTRA